MCDESLPTCWNKTMHTMCDESPPTCWNNTYTCTRTHTHIHTHSLSLTHIHTHTHTHLLGTEGLTHTHILSLSLTWKPRAIWVSGTPNALFLGDSGISWNLVPPTYCVHIHMNICTGTHIHTFTYT